MIYDFGANDGSNLEYYLSKDEVVAVEANPKLCERIRSRFARAIDDGKLTVLNVALADQADAAPVTFYVHQFNDLLSQLPEPDDLSSFEPISIPSRTAASIVEQYGAPSYVKVDVEHYDAAVLRNLFDASIYPTEISAEAHSAEVFALLAANGYNAFCLVEGFNVAERFPGFASHSAGPFGSDIGARWEDADTFLHTLAAEGLGWKDIHASKVIEPAPRPTGFQLAARQARSLSRRLVRRALR